MSTRTISKALVRVEVDGVPRWGRRDGDCIVFEDATLVNEGDARYLAPVEPSKILAVHLAYRSRVVEYAARVPSAPSYFMKPQTTLNGHRRPIPKARGANLPQLRGRARRGDRQEDEGRRRGRGARSRCRVRAAPTTSACTTSATPTAGRCSGSRARTASSRSALRSCRRPSSTRPPSRSARSQRRRCPGGRRRRPAVPGRLPACRPLAADHARGRRRRPHRHAGELATDERGRCRGGRDRPVSAASRTWSSIGTSI